MVNVLIVEDDPMARKLLGIFVDDHVKYRLAKAVDSADMAEYYCHMYPIDLVLMDVCTVGTCDGLEAAEKIKKLCPGVKIIVITIQPDHTFLERARAAGVDSFWYKGPDVEEILRVMDRTVEGESVYPDAPPTLKLGNAYSTELTDRELEVLRQLVEGDSDAVIAEKLHMSLRTVKTHIQNMREKTGFRNRTELAVKAIESGIIINRHRENIPNDRRI